MKIFSAAPQFRSRVHRIYPLLLLCAVGSVSAQNQLGEVVITATGSEQLLSATLAHATVITRQDIERSQAVDLISLLQREAGLQRTQNGGVGSVSTLFMRGAPSLQTLILIDGIAQNKQDASGSVSLEHVMLDNVERIEVVRGNVSAVYGSGAIGGVIQIFTRKGSGTPSISVTSELGPRGSRRLSGNANGGVGDTTIAIGVSRLTTDGFSAINTVQQPGANPDSDSYENRSFNLSVAHKLSDQHNFGLKVTSSVGETAYDNAFGAATDIQKSRTRLSQASVFSDNKWSNWRSRISLGEQSDKNRSADNGFFGSTDTFVTRATVLNWINTLALAGDWLLTAGLDKQHQRVDTTTTSAFAPYAVGRTASAVFAGVEGKVSDIGLQLNARHDRVGALEENTGYAGVSYAISDRFKLIGSVSTAFNAPPLGYLFAPGIGNPGLRPEFANSHEIGMQFAGDKQLLRATYFDTRVRDQLTFDTATFAFANIDRTRNKGLELSYKGVIGATDLRASLTLQEPTNVVTGQRLNRRAATLASVGVSHPIGAWRIDGDLRYSGKRPDAYTDPLTFTTVKTTLDAYAVLDLAVSYQWSPELRLQARLDNAFDRRYQTVYGYNQQPRSLYMGLTWAPKL